MYRCPNCDRSYTWRQTLSRHIKHECSTEPKFSCMICSLRFKQRGHLLRHMRKLHPFQLNLYYQVNGRTCAVWQFCFYNNRWIVLFFNSRCVILYFLAFICFVIILNIVVLWQFAIHKNTFYLQSSCGCIKFNCIPWAYLGWNQVQNNCIFWMELAGMIIYLSSALMLVSCMLMGVNLSD